MGLVEDLREFSNWNTIKKAADEIERLRGLSLCSSCPTDEPGRPYNAIICHQCAKESYNEQEAEIERLRAILLDVAKTKSNHCDYQEYGHREAVRLARESAKAAEQKGGD